MIRLEVEDYRNDCMSFAADVKPPHKEPHDWDDGYDMTDTIVKCVNYRRCANIKRYLEQQMTKGEHE